MNNEFMSQEVIDKAKDLIEVDLKDDAIRGKIEAYLNTINGISTPGATTTTKEAYKFKKFLGLFPQLKAFLNKELKLQSPATEVDEHIMYELKRHIIAIYEANHSTKRMHEEVERTLVNYVETITDPVDKLRAGIDTLKGYLQPGFNVEVHLGNIEKKAKALVKTIKTIEKSKLVTEVEAIGTAIESIKTEISKTSFPPYDPNNFPGTPHPRTGVSSVSLTEPQFDERNNRARSNVLGLLQNIDKISSNFLNKVEEFGLQDTDNIRTLQSKSQTVELLEKLRINDAPLLIADRQERFYHSLAKKDSSPSSVLPNIFYFPRRTINTGGDNEFRAGTRMSQKDLALFYKWALERKNSGNEDENNGLDLEQKEAIDQNAKYVYEKDIPWNRLLAAVGGKDVNFLTANERARKEILKHLRSSSWTNLAQPSQDDNYYFTLLAWHLGIKGAKTNNQIYERVVDALTEELVSKTRAEDPVIDTTRLRENFVDRMKSIYQPTTHARLDYLSGTAREIYEEVKVDNTDMEIGNLSQRREFIASLTNKIMSRRMELMKAHVDSKSPRAIPALMKRIRSKNTLIGWGALGIGTLGTLGLMAVNPAASMLGGGSLLRKGARGLFKVVAASGLGVATGVLGRAISRAGFLNQDNETVLAKRVSQAREFGATLHGTAENSEDRITATLPGFEDQDIPRRIKEIDELFANSRAEVYASIRDVVNEELSNGQTNRGEISKKALIKIYGGGGIEESFTSALARKQGNTNFANVASAIGTITATSLHLVGVPI